MHRPELLADDVPVRLLAVDGERLQAEDHGGPPAADVAQAVLSHAPEATVTNWVGSSETSALAVASPRTTGANSTRGMGVR